MGVFDLFKKKQPLTEKPRNVPEMLIAKLLFVEKPVFSRDTILQELHSYFNRVENPDGGNLYIFPEFEFDMAGARVHGQCVISGSEDMVEPVSLPEEAFQQNWHWEEANETARNCKFGLIVSDMLTRTMNYQQRLDLFMKVLVAVTKATNPHAIYCITSKKLLNPDKLVQCWDGEEREVLTALVNVRLFTITNSETPQILMDTVGLSCLGLPDFQILHKPSNESQLAQLLWNYAYYIFDNGDIIEDGNTVEGLVPGSKWKCERKMSIIKPERVIIQLQL